MANLTRLKELDLHGTPIKLKRLEIIKNAVAMEEDELVAMQLAKLKQLELDTAALHIVKLIEAQQFSQVIQLIEQYKHDHRGLAVFQDPQIQGLRLELKVLEQRANELSDMQAEIEREINEFNSECLRRLGALIEGTLKHRAELASDDAQAQQAQDDYDAFKRSYPQHKQDAPHSLTPKQQRQLKNAYHLQAKK